MSFERAALLREMGLGPVWRLRTREADKPASAVDERVVPKLVPAARPDDVTHPVAASRMRVSGESAGPARTPRPHAQASVARPHVPATPPVVGAPAGLADERGRAARIQALDWDVLEADMRACSACRLCEGRNQVVPGVGDRAAEWMLVGEGPGAEEDKRGEPFVGAAGRLLDDMLAAIGLARDQGVYIANAVKCRPPLNRTPQADEIATCLPYLSRQVALVRPRLLIALGRPAAQALLGEEVKINASRGRLFHREGTPVVVTYHPAYLLRNQADKARAWEDLCFARKALAELKRQDG